MSKPFEAELYGGEVELRRGANHVYRVRIQGGKSYPCVSVTGVVGMKDKSRALMPWQAGVIAHVVEKRTKALLDMLPADGVSVRLKDGTRAALRQGLRELKAACLTATDEIRDSAGDVGAQVHSYIEDYLNAKLARKERAPGTTGLDREVKRAVGQFAKWFVDNDVEVVATERPVFSRQYFYTGQTDCILRVRGVKGIWDFKTGKSVYNDVLLQTSAYREAYNEEVPTDPVEEGGVILFPREDIDPETKVLTGDMEVVRLPEELHEETFQAFLGLLALKKWDGRSYKALKAARA